MVALWHFRNRIGGFLTGMQVLVHDAKSGVLEGSVLTDI